MKKINIDKESTNEKWLRGDADRLKRYVDTEKHKKH